MKGDLAIVKTGLLDRIEEVCAKLLPDGRREGALWVSHNPVMNDRDKTPAFKVRIKGGDLGAWRCWRSGVSGDVLGLAAYALTGDAKNATAALAWGRDFLGLQRMSRADRDAMRRESEKRAAIQREEAERKRRQKLLNADRLFSIREGGRVDYVDVPEGAANFGLMTPAERHARAYFAARRCPIDGLPLERTMRFSPATEWWKGATWSREGGRSFKSQQGPLFPAVHSAMRNRMGIVTACHLTFLDPVRPAKAPVTPAKMMFGEALGAVIELSPGPSGVPFWMADRERLAPAPLILGEGTETVASFAPEIPEARCWAAGSLAGVAGAPVELECVSWVLFARDNNHGNAMAQKQFEQALAALEASGKRIVVEASHVGDDFNDLARGEE